MLVDVGKHRGSYRSGCRCAQCRAKETQRQCDYRARRAAAALVKPKLVGLPTNTTPNGPGEVEAATIAETACYAETRPAMVAQAKALGRIIDNESLVSMHPATSRQLQSVLTELHSATKRKAKGRLASVQSMTHVRRVT
jgi:hypothetical protein